ncbi:HDOD domain-containing protein [Clostridium tyrobutyricum]|jgi:EAL and modified HD-GYP domain-containing signal transduction protein|uniref:EAL and HDOD domain-containing protein n=2 Tax=Clostridium tyrobutyricum TaxID=1519 RepID=UPI00030061A4|nr:HDOD domain-containing protein [Clostridium tyrobutyricum]MBV4415437.1 HDOD domain-containing protein [Clostridium tyrobutyricum]MBV4422138.1 HDOD domain-containing protein [Clostridium tyrobutyricum]MBV4431303.1 HDOD domain-containing protein [Clostridium tyrobutyricum]MBV4437336.1 HDOD domain-containing protein [Clostridium tyrobutyricum]MBV4440653.1 HDOD domain-containing protein [Clostridium tyrobutyricum]
MDIFLARQPILDKYGKIISYEILFRNSGTGNTYKFNDGDEATIKVMQNILINIGMEKIVGHKKAFINFTENILKSDLYSLIPSENVVIELLEDIVPSENVVNSCRILKKSGFTIALDDFVFNDSYTELVKLADIIKVDFLLTKGQERKGVLDTARNINPDLKFLAEKVETLDEFNEALSLGYSYFQGYYFSKPQIVKGKKIEGNKLIYLKLIKELSSKKFSLENIQNLIKKDVSMSYEILKLINSAKYYFKNKIKSINHAVSLLGENEIKKWLYFICMKPICSNRPQIVMLESLLRAEFLEKLAKKTALSKNSSNFYLMGIMSLMDVILQMPLIKVLDELMISKDIKYALTGRESNYYSKMLDIVISFRTGNWDKSMLMASSYFNLNCRDLQNCYMESIRWVDEVTL